MLKRNWGQEGNETLKNHRPNAHFLKMTQAVFHGDQIRISSVFKTMNIVDFINHYQQVIFIENPLGKWQCV